MQGTLSQFYSALAVVPSDTTLVTCRAIYVGGAGNVTVTPRGGVAVTFTAPPVGSVIPIALEQGLINSTLTTATLLVALA
jgi:hypothetical protein